MSAEQPTPPIEPEASAETEMPAEAPAAAAPPKPDKLEKKVKAPKSKRPADAPPGLVSRAVNTPVRDLARGRLSGRLDLRQTVARTTLPPSLRRLVYDVSGRTRLWSLEQADVARELSSHFLEGLDRGESPEALIAAFGSRRRAARLIRRAKRRQRGALWRAWRRTVQVAFLLLVVLVGLYAAAAYRLMSGKPEIKQDYLAMANARASAVPAAQRAWPEYRAALMELRDMPTWGERVRPGYAGWVEVERYLERHGAVIKRVREAAGRPGLGYHAGFEIDEADRALWPHLAGASAEGQPRDLSRVLLPYLEELNKLTKLLSLDALRAADRGDGAVALDDIQAILGLSEHAFELPYVINNIRAFAAVTLAANTVGEILTDAPEVFSDDQLRALAHMLAAAHGGSLRARFDGEHYWFLDLVQRMYTDDGNGDGRITAEGLYALHQLPIPESVVGVSPLAPVAGLVVAGRQDMSDEFDRWLALAEAESSKPLWRQDPERITRELQRRTDSTLYIARYLSLPLLVETLGPLGRSAELVTQQRDAIGVAIALELYRRRHGDWPDRLELLVPSMLPMIPVDRFDGRPIKYRVENGAPILYSVGADTDDDGGRQPEGGRAARQATMLNHDRTPLTDSDWVLWPIRNGWGSRTMPTERAQRPAS